MLKIVNATTMVEVILTEQFSSFLLSKLLHIIIIIKCLYYLVCFQL